MSLIDSISLQPRWRTMIEPAVTSVPSYTLTPRRWAFESRPFLVEPPPLVFDMALSLRDSGDFDASKRLTVTPPTTVIAGILVNEAVDLGALDFVEHLGRNRSACEISGVRQHGRPINYKHWTKINVAADGTNAFNFQDLALFDLVLFSAGGDYCIHNCDSLTVLLTVAALLGRKLGHTPRFVNLTGRYSTVGFLLVLVVAGLLRVGDLGDARARDCLAVTEQCVVEQ